MTSFTFSQSSLQDYADCARRFELRYLDRLRWPAVRAEPVLDHERKMQRGAQFHHLLHQQAAGIPAATLARTLADDPALGAWWAQVIAWLGQAGLPAQRYPEITLSAGTGIPTPSVPLSQPSTASGRGASGEGSDADDDPPPPEYRLMAKYDLMAIAPGERAIILDWKTTAPQSRDSLVGRWQTIVYRWVLAQAGQDINGGQPIPPEQIEMIYWYTGGAPVSLRYDQASFERDGLLLRGLIEQINQASRFPLTDDERHCRFCTYRSLCDRGRAASTLDELEGWEDESVNDLHIDLEQVAEVEF
jgi:hypothetical protein